MQPLSTIPAGTWTSLCRRCRGIFSDIDDTLTEDGVLVTAAYEQLVRARVAGLRIVLVTGRPLGWAEVLASLFPIDAAIAENGAVAAFPGGRRLYYEDEPARAAGNDRRRLAQERVRQELPQVKPASDQPLRDVDLAFDIGETVTLPAKDIAQLVAVLESCGLSTTRSSIHLHGSYSRADKAKMAARVAADLWNEPEASLRSDYIFVGDSPNDAPAFRFFEHSIGVANVARHESALEALRALPWAVTALRSGSGFAEAIACLLAHK